MLIINQNKIMKAKLTLLLSIFLVGNLFAQTDSLKLKKDIDILNGKVLNLESKIETIQTANTKILQENESIKNSQAIQNKNSKQLNSDFETYKLNAGNEIDSLLQVINSNSKNIQTTANELGVKIDNTHDFANQSIIDLNKTVSQNTLYWIIAILVVALLVILVFVFLRKQIFKQKTDLDSNLQDTRKALEEEGVKLDNKLIEVLETHLKIINNSNSGSEKEADHTLALKVADEIVRIEKNISKMDNEIKGLKPLVKGIERIKDNFKANGYDMVQLLDKEYDDGMNIDVINFIDDDTIPLGKKIITRIIKPQVNYRDVLIQRAQVDVSQN
jgi:cytochrome c-type biogenesis protein CcmH/NrfF